MIAEVTIKFRTLNLEVSEGDKLKFNFTIDSLVKLFALDEGDGDMMKGLAELHDARTAVEFLSVVEIPEERKDV